MSGAVSDHIKIGPAETLQRIHAERRDELDGAELIL